MPNHVRDHAPHAVHAPHSRHGVRLLSWLSIVASLLALTQRAHAELSQSDDDQALVAPEPTRDSPVYQVRRGDTLGAIALRANTSQHELLRLNPDLQPDRIREGQILRLEEGGRRVEHVVQPGEVLLRVSAHYEVSLAQLQRWNPKLDPDRVRAGQKLIVYTSVPDSRSESVGTPSSGQLLFAARVPAHPAYVLRNPERAWATRETVRDLVAAFEALRERDPEAPRVRVHDLSLREGGPMDDHHSHQSGRDVDITYYRKRCAGPCPLGRVAPSELDVARQWALLEHWLLRGRAEAIFIDYALQAKLHAHARKQGVSREQLLHWFQFPRGKAAPVGIVRHVRNHADHVHVRFVCDDTDAECQMFRVKPVQASIATR